MKEYFEYYYGRKFNNWIELININKKEFRNIIKLIYSILTRNNFYINEFHINCVQLLMCIALDRNFINKFYYKKIIYEYNKISNVSKINHDTKFEDIIELILNINPNSEIFVKSSNKILYA